MINKKYRLDIASGRFSEEDDFSAGPVPSSVSKSCSTCVQMTQDNQSMEQELLLLKRRNKTLVTVNRVLRERSNELQREADILFEEMYKFDNNLDQVALDDQIDLAFE